MENLNENQTISLNEKSRSKKESKPVGRRLGIKILIISVLGLMFLVPQQLLLQLVRERQGLSECAKAEVYDKWGAQQTICGPVIHIPALSEKENDIYILPENLEISGNVKTEERHRGIFDITVYNSDLKTTGEFAVVDRGQIGPKYDYNNAEILFSVSDLKGLCDNVTVNVDGEEYKMQSGRDPQFGNCLRCKLENGETQRNRGIAFTVNIKLKGSESIKFLPTGNSTTVNLTSNCQTPSFQGNFLPNTHNVSDGGFSAQWNILSINRNFGQIISNVQKYGMSGGDRHTLIFDENEFGADLKVPVMQYQQTERTVKYAFLFILLTFATVFFVEYRAKTPIHPIQYLLIGFALLIFYSILLSLSEHIPFFWSYVVAMVMVVALISVFVGILVKSKKTALLIAVFLIALYAFIYILLQLETYALLAGSAGLFVILAIAMFASMRIKWYNE